MIDIEERQAPVTLSGQDGREHYSVNIDRELVTGDSPKAAQKLGVVAVTMAIAALSRPENDSAVR